MVKKTADYGCLASKVGISYFNQYQYEHLRLPSGNYPGTSGVVGAANTAGTAIAGYGYSKAIKEAGDNAKKEYKTLLDKYFSEILRPCDEGIYLNPTPNPEPSPTPKSDDYALCEYTCKLLSEGSVYGIDACLYGNCSNPRQVAGNGNCPGALPGMFTVKAEKEAGCVTCALSITTTESYTPGKPFEVKPSDAFVYNKR